jgi:signal transduction histidine kinase
MHRSIRFRLTILVSVLFFVTLLVVGLVVRERLQRSLENDAQVNAAEVLEGFFASGSQPVGASAITRFVFFGESGEEISPQEFERLISESINSVPSGVAIGESMLFPMMELGPVSFEGVTTFTPVLGDIQATGVPQVVEFDPEAVVLASPVSVGGLDLAVGVSSPRGPIEEAIQTTSIVGVVLLPLLTAQGAGATWMTTARALRPVEAIRQQVEQTEPGRLDVRVPKSGKSDEIDRLAGTMNDMLDRLDGAAEQQRQFISDASHELRSPITATLATVETLDLGNEQELETATKLIIHEQRRLAGLVDDLLMLAQLDEAGPQRANDVDVDDLAITEAQRAHPCAVNVEITDACRVAGSVSLLRRCVSNLVDNATRHALSQVEITVGTTVRGEARLRVDDDGPGVPRERRGEIFERFTRLDESRQARDGGAGLGLAIAKNIAEQHDASLVVTDSPLGGARFELRFSAVR